MKIKKQKLGRPAKNYFTQEYIEHKRLVNAPPPKSTVPIATFRIECVPVKTFTLSEAKTSVCIGTLSGCNEGKLLVDESYIISPLHCQLKRNPRVEGCNHTAFVRDLSFNSSTFVNDRRIGFGNSMELHSQDFIRIGEHPIKHIKIRYSDNEYHDARERLSRRFRMPPSLYNLYEVRSEEYLGK
ncbi:10830_t:CDS:2 [Cetraspora pellucida]|uniref:10830_t:CDS:1 n=1 Tax=Cetraspora pellucida TaxID=1433469 RepID=A0ACA9PB21_9GLOM|nr:10830_t:CDS:2 [Cetraspora pellucida]